MLSIIHKNKLYKQWILPQNYEDECKYKNIKSFIQKQLPQLRKLQTNV